MMNEATRLFVRQHADDDVRMLALRGSKDPDVDLMMALRQIQGRQTARRKLPSWAAVESIVYPPHLNMEQCSSEATASYKAALCRRLLAPAAAVAHPCAGSVAQQSTSLLDLTGGLGVDFSFMQAPFSSATYVERDAQLFAVSSKNFAALGLTHVQTVCADATDYLSRHAADRHSLVYLDPARRDDHGARTFGIADCTPDVLRLLPTLLPTSGHVLLKLSPMLDWRKAVADVGPDHVAEVHIVSVRNECKELLLLLCEHVDETVLFCVNDALSVAFRRHDLSVASSVTPLQPAPGLFLYEPNASLMKAGCFDALGARYGVGQLARDSHLFLASSAVSDFPGRAFIVEAVSPMNRRDLRQVLQGVSQANLSVRNFPLNVAELRRRLKLTEGGSKYIFATTLSGGEHVLLICRKLS